MIDTSNDDDHLLPKIFDQRALGRSCFARLRQSTPSYPHRTRDPNEVLLLLLIRMAVIVMVMVMVIAMVMLIVTVDGDGNGLKRRN